MAEFLTVNLGSMLRNQKSLDDLESAEQKAQKTPQKSDLSKISDWGKELKDRLARNNQLDADSRESEYDVEAKFFEDFFNSGWNTACAKQLISLGEPLKKILKVLGFDKEVNPILGFISNKYVIKNLLQTKLLNTNTFQALFNAVAKKLVASSEFFEASDYNIIYCQDLYKRSASEIEKYLSLQQSILKPSAEEYTREVQEKNIKVFFFIEGTENDDIEKRKAAIEKSIALPSAMDSSTILNKYKISEALANVSSKSGKAAEDNEESTSVSPTKVQVVVKKLKKATNFKAQFFATLQYVSMVSGIPEAQRALKHTNFKELTAEQIRAAGEQVAPLMKEAKLSRKEAKYLVTDLLKELE